METEYQMDEFQKVQITHSLQVGQNTYANCLDWSGQFMTRSDLSFFDNGIDNASEIYGYIHAGVESFKVNNHTINRLEQKVADIY